MKNNAGFTLIEILMTLGILSVLAVLSLSRVQESSDESKFNATLRQMIEIRNAMIGDPELKNGTHRTSYGFLGDIGAIPTAGQGIAALTTNPSLPAWAINTSVRFGIGWNGPYVHESFFSNSNPLQDAWGTPFVYSPAASPPTLVSYGADQASGGTGLKQDITVLLPTALTTATIHGVITSGGVQWSGAAEVETNYVNGSGVLAQTLQSVVAANKGIFTVSSIPLGTRSITVYLPSKAAATNTYGPYIIDVNRAHVLSVINIPATTPTHSFTVVQSITGTSCQVNTSAATTVSCTFPAGTQSGNQILFSCASASPLVNTTPASTLLLARPAVTWGYNYLGLASSVTAGTTTIKFNPNHTYTEVDCVVAEVSGLVSSSPVDVSSAWANGAYGTSVSTGSVTTTNANDVVVGFMDTGAGTCTAGAGYTMLSAPGNGGATMTTCFEYKTLTSTGANNPSLTYGAAQTTQVATIAFKLQ